MWNILWSIDSFFRIFSVPDLSEYQVWLGVSDIREGAPDWSKTQEVSIAHVICGPEGSSLALIRLSKWVPGKIISKINYIYTCVCVCMCDVDHALYFLCAGRPFLQTMSIRFSCLWLGAPSQKEHCVKCMDGARPKVQLFYTLFSLQLLHRFILFRSPRSAMYCIYIAFFLQQSWFIFCIHFFPLKWYKVVEQSIS